MLEDTYSLDGAQMVSICLDMFAFLILHLIQLSGIKILILTTYCQRNHIFWRCIY